MFKIPKAYSQTLRQSDFFVLILTLLLGQVATGFLLVSLISSVFTKTGSNFAVSGVILSLSIPGFLLTAAAGLVADLFDRKKLIIAANATIAVVVLLILFSFDKVFASISLSFLYFAGNTFFIPAVSAASAQLVKRSALAFANSIFILSLAGGQIFGLFVASLIHFFFGSLVTLVISEILLSICIFLPLLLPRLAPRKNHKDGILVVIFDIWKAFIYIFTSKIIWFFFITFAAMQGIVAFGATLGPGFFGEVVGLSIESSLLFILPLIAFGILLGALFVSHPKIKESFFVALGLGVLGLNSAILAIIIKSNILSGKLLLFPLTVFMLSAGFGVITPMIAARTVLQKRVYHAYQGTVFGANIVLAALIASIMSPAAAGFEAFFGYVNVIFVAGIVFLISSFLIAKVGKRWKF